MAGVPLGLYARLRKILLNSGQFISDRQLQNVFVDSRLSPWRHSLPQADSPLERVNNTITFLMEKRRADTKTNALVLLLRVLGDMIDQGDDCKRRLAGLADELEANLKKIEEGAWRVDIAIITALPMELDALLRHSGPWHVAQSSRSTIRTYHHSILDNNLSLVAACAIGIGQLNAALLSRDIIDEWHPSKIILVGIAGALKAQIEFGDIVISEQVVDYELGKVTPSGAEPRWSVYPSDSYLLEKLIHFQEDREWVSRITIQRPGRKKDVVPKAHFGVVLSGNKVMSDEITSGMLKSVWARAVAIEMEAAGIAAALYQQGGAPGFIMIKGISDRANSKKDDKWQNYAADVAGAFVTSFIIKSLQPGDI